MNAPLDPPPPPQAMRRLADFLAESGSTLTPAQAAAEAIEQWIGVKRGQLPQAAVAPTRGYRWKSLFLPEGTRLRMHCGGRDFDATVEGNELIFEGRAMSPRQMMLAVSGHGYNAWRALWVLLPGAMRWRPASALRREAGQEQPKMVSPLEAMTAAAACMSETLKTALALVDHVNRQGQPPVDRRIDRRRRASDALEDTCMLD